MATRNHSDRSLKDAQRADIVIPVIGATGAGKSTFINSLLTYFGDSRRVVVGKELVSCTSQLEAIVIEGQTGQWKRINGNRIVIVDTPGFDDNPELLQRIEQWLKKSYGKKMVLGGVIYLHDISRNRLSHTARSNIEKLNHLCGDSTLDNVVLVTSKWGWAVGENPEKREAELRDNHWSTMLARGAKLERLVTNEEKESAWRVVQSILAKVDARTIEQPSHNPRNDVDQSLRDARETDIVIPVMGATGAGKSTFINFLLTYFGDSRRVAVGKELVSCTSQLEGIVIEGKTSPWKRINGNRIVIVDTPGFDDTYAGDFEILQRIARWLEESYRKKMVLGGVIYLHDISQDRFSTTARRNLDLFSLLCGDSALDKVVLVTSKWGRAFGRNFEKREAELKINHWKTMLGGGAEVERLVANEETESAWRVVHSILNRVETRTIEQTRSEALQIQKELVNRRKFLPQTHAGRELRSQLEQMLQAQTQMLALEADTVAGNEEGKAELREQEEKVKQMAQQIEHLKVSLPKRLGRWTKLVKGD